MSRRKQANPAKLGESDGLTPTVGAAPKETDTFEEIYKNTTETDADADEPLQQEEDYERDEDIDLMDMKEDELDGDEDEDDDGSLLNGQGSSPSSSSDQASPASSCQSSLSDAADAEESFTMGATATTPYECNICKRAFARSSLLSKHVQTHTEQLQFSCPYCRRLFKHKRSRDRHTKLHTGDKKYKCLHCDSAFARSDHLKIHMKTHDNKKPHQCELCNRGYNTAAALASHQQHHSKQEQRRCGSSASRSSAVSTPSPGNFRCLQCPDTFDKSESLQNHLLANHKLAAVSPVATQPTNNAEANNLMLKSPILQIDLPKIACMYCGKDFLSMNHMYQHIHAEHRAIFNSISQNMNYTAAPPLQSPGAIEDLSPKQHARPNSTPTYACDRCTMRFDSPLLLQEHIETVHWAPTTPTMYKYEKSPPVSASQSKPTDLSRKRRADNANAAGSTHEYNKSDKRKVDEPVKQTSPATAGSPYDSNDKPCICSYCYAQMPNFKMFLLHMETHVAMNAGTAPTIANTANTIIGCCPLCGEPARNALELGRHIFGHAIANVTAHCCHSCKKPFDKVEHLHKHLTDAHSQTVFKCTICNDLFDTQLALQMHFSNKHSPECKHYRCNLCSEQVFHDRLTAELHVNMKHSLQAPLGGGNTRGSSYHHLARFPAEVEQQRVDFPIYQCPFCQKIFKDEYLQYVHILKEHNETREGENYLLDAASTATRQLYGKTSPPAKHQKPIDIKPNNNYICEICNRADIASDAELAAHKKLHHAKTKVSTVSLQCAYCNEHCKSRTDLENHMKSHQVACGKGKHKCNICDEIFSSSATLAEHKLSHCKIVAGNSCTQCKTHLVDEQSFYNHQLQHSNHNTNTNTSTAAATVAKNNLLQISLPANCIICCQTLQTDVEIKLHAKFHLRHLFQKEFICAVCNKLYDGLHVSMKQIEKNNALINVNICKDCATHSNNGNYNTAGLNVVNEYKEKNLFACLKCPQTFNTEDDIQNHAADHMMNEEPNLECHLCRNVLASPSKLQVHLIEHNFMGMGQYRCYVCSSVFTTAVGLRSHIIGHGLNHRPYECTDCKMKFFFETELENHKYMHLHVKTYAKTKNGCDLLGYDKYIECKHCLLSIPEALYYSEHVLVCNNASNKVATTAAVDAMANDTSAHIKIENKDDLSLNDLTSSGLVGNDILHKSEIKSEQIS